MRIVFHRVCRAYNMICENNQATTRTTTAVTEPSASSWSSPATLNSSSTAAAADQVDILNIESGLLNQTTNNDIHNNCSFTFQGKTTSKSISNRVVGARIDFQNIYSTVTLKKNKTKIILNNVSGHVNPGRLTAIIGVSPTRLNAYMPEE